jgi:hypothetical protein
LSGLFSLEKSYKMAATFGSVGEYNQSEEEWRHYVERVECFLSANEITDANRKRSVFLAMVGAKTYGLLRGLSNNVPMSKTFTELCNLMERHANPMPNEIAERYVFNSRSRKENETISDYITVLRKLSEHCNYGDKLGEQIRDWLVCGVRNEKIQQRLLSEGQLTLEHALEIATSMESAARYKGDSECNAR